MALDLSTTKHNYPDKKTPDALQCTQESILCVPVSYSKHFPPPAKKKNTRQNTENAHFKTPCSSGALDKNTNINDSLLNNRVFHLNYWGSVKLGRNFTDLSHNFNIWHKDNKSINVNESVPSISFMQGSNEFVNESMPLIPFMRRSKWPHFMWPV